MSTRPEHSQIGFGWLTFSLTILVVTHFFAAARAEGPGRARSDSDARYLHFIDFYDVDNRKITAESKLPYSPKHTCGRCHDYETIGHGWHFNAFDASGDSGRKAEPWVWTDARTGTQLPLSYRDWDHTFDPRPIGISTWAMTRHFGGRTPGGSFSTDNAKASGDGDSTTRWDLSGSLEIDCLACHAVDGTYDINARREQVERQNFAWAPTAAIGFGVVEGNVSRIKDGSDPESEAVKKKLPRVTYDERKFGIDGKVFVDLVRQPTSNACYQCHSRRTVSFDPANHEHPFSVDQRWVHDEDVHLRAGMVCADCHRNGIDHDTVRGFEGEADKQGQAVQTLSCRGCHLGGDHHSHHDENHSLIGDRPGRLGSPLPGHEGLPPLHFDRLSCTACHGGPVPRESAVRMMTSLAHGLGESAHRSGDELPAIVGPVFTQDDSGKIYPHQAMWPAFWGQVSEEGKIVPLDPDLVFSTIRKTLRVRKDLVSELLEPKLKSSEKKDLLGEERAKVKPDQWTEQERSKLEQARHEKGQQQFQEKISASLRAIQETLDIRQAVFVSTGKVYVAGRAEGTLDELSDPDPAASSMITWPIAHNIRPAGWSLGKNGCVECHADDGLIFASTVSAVGPIPTTTPPLSMAALQGVDPSEQEIWNQLFSGRSFFKSIITGSLLITLFTLLIAIARLSTSWNSKEPS